MTGVDPAVCERGEIPLFPAFPFLFPSPPLRSSPLKPAKGLGSLVSSPNGVRGRAPAENEFGAL